MSVTDIHHWHACGGIGSGAAGFNDASPQVGQLKGRMVCTGGIDVDAKACADFKRLTGVEQMQLDGFTLAQYQAWHGHMPPAGWREATPEDIRRSSQHIFPNIVFTSMPCKGFSGLLSSEKSISAKYQALNELTLRICWLVMEAFADNPPELFIFENVPRIATRGRHLLDQIFSMWRHYGYATNETAHDCGEIGHLAQSRKRFLGVARHVAKVPAFLYEPVKRPLRAVGDLLRHMPMPGDPAGGPMHRTPALQWKTWVRLAFVEAGSDWRSLNKLEVEDGMLRDYLIVPQAYNGYLGVNKWSESSGAVTSRAGPTNGVNVVADPRHQQSAKWCDGQAYGVHRWSDSMGAIAGQQNPGQGKYAVADPRHSGPAKHSNEFRIVKWDGPARAVTSAHGTGQALADPRMAWGTGAHEAKLRVTGWESSHGSVTGARGPYSGACAVADPRASGEVFAKYSVAEWSGAARTVIAGSTTGEGAYAVADPRAGMRREKGDAYLTGGHYGVIPWSSSSGAVSAAAGHDSGRWSVADPREVDENPNLHTKPADDFVDLHIPKPADKLVCRIQSLDGTWHRPFTTLELAALQSIIDPEEWFAPGGAGESSHFMLEGSSDQRWREGIGNAVPRKAAKAIGEVMGQTILMSRLGETFTLSSQAVWVQPVALALTMPGAPA